MRYKKNMKDKIVNPKKIYKFTSQHFLIRHVVFVLIVKNFVKNLKFYFAPSQCEIRKNFRKENCLFQEDLQISL